MSTRYDVNGKMTINAEDINIKYTVNESSHEILLNDLMNDIINQKNKNENIWFSSIFYQILIFCLYIKLCILYIFLSKTIILL